MYVPATSHQPPVTSRDLPARTDDMLGFQTAPANEISVRSAFDLVSRIVHSGDNPNNNSSTPGITPAKIAGIVIAVVVFLLAITLRCFCAGRELKKARRNAVPNGASADDDDLKKLLNEEQKKKLYGSGALWNQFWKGSGYSKTTVGIGNVDFKTWESGPRRDWGPANR